MIRFRDALIRLRASGWLWNGALVVVDATVIAAAAYLAYLARFDGPPPEPFARWLPALVIASSIAYMALFAALGLYRLLLRYVSLDTLLRLAGAVAAGSVVLLAMDLVAPRVEGMRPVPVGVVLNQAVLVFVGTSAARLAARVFLHLRAIRSATGKRVLIAGAGSAGSLLLREILNRPDLGLTVVGFLDDDQTLHGRTLDGVPVLGSTDLLAQAVVDHGVEELLVALPSAPDAVIRRLLNAAADLGLETRVMPPLVIEKGAVTLRDLRPVEVEDLLGREQTPIDVEEVRSTVVGRTVLVTGAAGSIGSELSRQVASLGAGRVVLADIDETRLYELWLEMERAFPGVAAMRICDVRDASRLAHVFEQERPHVVLHAAAYKHVPVMEHEPAEAVRVNVEGTLNLLEACEKHGTERFVLISTDKAVLPANVMGMTKRVAELVTMQHAATGRVACVTVRFGNVLGSRGSVVPLLTEQLKRGGPLTVTHPDATRYFMTIPEAARLVLQAQAIGRSGDVFVLEMGEPVRIADLARKMIALSGVPAEIEFVGLRPGEKLHESLVCGAEELVPTERPKILRVSASTAPDAGFATTLAELVAAAQAGDDERVRGLLPHVACGNGS
ncbi:MAG: polysaccharide biosynthesis protein [Coriobacteriia bacterium]|nr:polysaccharide biosynthesis protein [Coriobacteriia bacterium]